MGKEQHDLHPGGRCLLLYLNILDWMGNSQHLQLHLSMAKCQLAGL